MRRLDEALASLMRLIRAPARRSWPSRTPTMILRHLGAPTKAGGGTRPDADACGLQGRMDRARPRTGRRWRQVGRLDAIERAIALDPRDSFASPSASVNCSSAFSDGPTLLPPSRRRALLAARLSILGTYGIRNCGHVATRVLVRRWRSWQRHSLPPRSPNIPRGRDSRGLLSTELQLRVRFATARALGELRAHACAHRQQGVLADVFTVSCRRLWAGRCGERAWRGLADVRVAVDGSADCRLPLEMLSVVPAIGVRATRPSCDSAA